MTAPCPPQEARLLRPGIFVSIYNDLRGVRSLPILAELQRHAAPGDLGVAIHDPPSDDDAALSRDVRAAGLRLIYGWGTDPDARRTVRDAAATTRRRARLAADRGAEAVELNGEAAWKAPGLSAHAREMLGAAREGAPGLPVAWSYFDGPDSHEMEPETGRSIFGPGGVDYSAPQVYASDPGAPGLEDHRDARRRWDRAVAQHEAMVRRGIYRPELVPGREACAVYLQIHGVSSSCVAWLGNKSDVVRAWALPTRCDESGLRGLEYLLIARARFGRSAGAIERAQAALGLTVDGVCGPQTGAALLTLRG